VHGALRSLGGRDSGRGRRGVATRLQHVDALGHDDGLAVDGDCDGVRCGRGRGRCGRRRGGRRGQLARRLRAALRGGQAEGRCASARGRRRAARAARVGGELCRAVRRRDAAGPRISAPAAQRTQRRRPAGGQWRAGACSGGAARGTTRHNPRASGNVPGGAHSAPAGPGRGAWRAQAAAPASRAEKRRERSVTGQGRKGSFPYFRKRPLQLPSLSKRALHSRIVACLLALRSSDCLSARRRCRCSFSSASLPVPKRIFSAVCPPSAAAPRRCDAVTAADRRSWSSRSASRARAARD